MKGVVASIVVAVVILVGLDASAYIVTEAEQVIITQFGEPMDTVTESGLHFRIPFVQEVHRLEKRLLPWDGSPENIPTKDKKRIYIDVWARWRIVEPMKFFQAVRTVGRGQTILDDNLDSAVRDVVARYNLIECVRSTNEQLRYAIENLEENQEREAEHIEAGREQLEREMLKQVNAAGFRENYGMEVADVHLKRVNYIPNVRERVHQRMVAERTRIAKLFESEAEEERNRILGNTRKELDEIEGDREQRSAEIRGEADAAVIKIYAQAISGNAEFYKFLRQLEAYRSTLGPRTRLILSTDSEFMKLLRGTGSPEAAQP